MKNILTISNIQILNKKAQRTITGGGFGPCSQQSDCGSPDCWICVQPKGRCLLLNSCPQ